MLVRQPERVAAALEPLGWTTDDVEVVQGDVLGRPVLTPASHRTARRSADGTAMPPVTSYR